jgi:tRNA dimethylallyltransferase
VERLRARGDLNLDKPAMRAVGYRQMWAYLDGALDKTALVEQSLVATRQFAKRQLTWLRAESEAIWLDSHDGCFLDRAIAQVYEQGVF